MTYNGLEHGLKQEKVGSTMLNYHEKALPRNVAFAKAYLKREIALRGGVTAANIGRVARVLADYKEPIITKARKEKSIDFLIGERGIGPGTLTDLRSILMDDYHVKIKIDEKILNGKCNIGKCDPDARGGQSRYSGRSTGRKADGSGE